MGVHHDIFRHSIVKAILKNVSAPLFETGIVVKYGLPLSSDQTSEQITVVSARAKDIYDDIPGM